MRLQYLLPAVLLASCAHRQVSPVSPGVRTSTFEQVGRVLPFELGASEFHGGDAIAITEVRGTDSTFAIGSSFVVRGHYSLMSHDKAMLLLSITATDTPGNSSIDPESRLNVMRGEGEFTLHGQITYAGYPHITFYGMDGMPIGGVYFGNGRALFKSGPVR